MTGTGLTFSRAHEMPGYYKQLQIGARRVDFLMEGTISMELKAIIVLTDVHLAQAISQPGAYDLGAGSLINFVVKSLQFKRQQTKNSNKKNQGNPHIK